VTVVAATKQDLVSSRAEVYWQEAYRAHFQAVWHAVRRLGGRPADLEDLVHDVFVVFHRTLARFDHERPVRPWLLGIAARVVADYRKQARFRREVAHETVEKADQRPGPAEHQKRVLVQKGLDALPLEQRIVFVMVELHGASVVETARELDIKMNTAYSRLRLARKTFAEVLRRPSVRAEEG
jgi:RNA polymerase sigma-70 factor (ECF subfamily)